MKNQTKQLITICVLSISLSAGIALVPVLSDISNVYPKYSDWVHLLITLPSLFMMFSSLLTNQLSRKISLKTTTIASLVLILFSGVSPFFIDGFSYLLISRALMGIGLGLLNTSVASLPALYFENGKSRDNATGIQAAFISAGGILFNLLSGTLAKSNWKLVFLVQLINIFPLAIAIFLMPKVENKKDKQSAFSLKSILVKEAIPVAFLAFSIILLTCTYPLNLSKFSEANNLGDSQFVAALTSINSLIGFVVGMIFAKVYSKLKNNTLILGLLFASVALIFVSNSSTSISLVACNILFGFGSSLISPSLHAKLYEETPEESILPAVALLGIASNVSQFVSPFVINPIAGLLRNSSVESQRFLVAGIILVATTIILFVKNRLIKSRSV